MIINSIPGLRLWREKGSGDVSDCVGSGERSKERWGWCGRGTHKNMALDTLKEERQEGQRLSAKWKHSIFNFNDSIKRCTRPRGQNWRYSLRIGAFLGIFSYHSECSSDPGSANGDVKPKIRGRKKGAERWGRMHTGERDTLHPPAGTEMSSQAQSSVRAGEESQHPSHRPARPLAAGPCECLLTFIESTLGSLQNIVVDIFAAQWDRI